VNVRSDQFIEMLLDVRPTRELNFLLDVKARHGFDDDFGDDAAGADAADRGLRKIVLGFAFMDLTFAVNQFDARDLLAAPCLPPPAPDPAPPAPLSDLPAAANTNPICPRCRQGHLITIQLLTPQRGRPP